MRTAKRPEKKTGEFIVRVLVVLGLCCVLTPAFGAIIVVTNTADSGVGSLRAALASAAYGDTIDARSVTGTITLTTGELLVSNSVTIIGPGPAMLAVDGNFPSNTNRVFHIIIVINHVTIAGLTITNGAAVGDAGGGIANFATLTVTNCTLSGNVADTGGAIYNDIDNLFMGRTLTIIDSSINGNSAGAGGGIYNLGTQAGGSAVLVVSNCTIAGNSAGSGGGIFNEGTSRGFASAKVIATTLSGNSAGSGGGIFNIGSGGSTPGAATLTIVGCTFSGNSTNGIFNFANNATATVQVGDTIFNTGAPNTSITNAFGSIVSLGYNLCSDGGAGFLTNSTDQINTDPMLGPLADNGGPTLTHALLPGSPATDQGKNLAGSTTDQRGLPRPVDDPCIANASGGDGSDIGAFEVQSTCQPPVDFSITAVDRTGNDLRISYTTTLGSNYVVQASSNLMSGSWASLPGTNSGIGVVQQIIVSNAFTAPQGFYRIQRLP